MIKFIYGDHGTGKTEYLSRQIAADAAQGRRCILLVPEQYSVTAEKRILSMVSREFVKNVEVLNFSRLANELSRKVGGLVYNYASTGVRRVIMQIALKAAAPLLTEYSLTQSQEKGFADALLATADELRVCGIDPDALVEAAREEEERRKDRKEESRLNARKLSDIAAVISFYRQILTENFTEQGAELERLADTSLVGECFSDAYFYLDSFSGLTGVEHRACAALMACAAGFTVTLPLPRYDYKSPDTVALRRMSDRLRADAASTGRNNETVTLETAYRYSSESLRRAALDIWSTAKTDPVDSDGSVNVVSVIDCYDEAEICAATVRSLVEGGARYRDIAIVARDAETYRGILDRAFEDAGIPLFFSEKIPLSHSAPSRLILAVLRLVASGCRPEDVTAFLKTGLCPFEDEQIDLFEMYVERWNIRSSGFASEWKNHPDGFKPSLDDRAKETLKTVNEIRAWVWDTVEKIDGAFKSAASCSDIAAALYDFLQSLGVAEKLAAESALRAAEGRMAEAAELAAAYRGTVEVLDEFCDAYGPKRLPDPLSALSALSVLFESKMIGSIPDSSDSVVFGSADMLRADGPRFVMLLGVQSGSFPATPRSGGLLTDEERDALIGAKLPLMRDSESAASDELYYFRRAISSASEKVFFFSSRPEGSIPLIRLKKLVNYKMVSSSDIIEERITTPSTAAGYERLLTGTPLGDALKTVVVECRADGRLPAVPENPEPVSALEVTLDPAAAEVSYPKKLRLSQSEYETFNKCPMKYVLQYKAGIAEEGTSGFSAAEAGSFTHLVLEKIMKELFSKGAFTVPDYEERKKMIRAIAEDYISKNVPTPTAHLLHTVERLEFLSNAFSGELTREMSESKFVPIGYELKTGRDFPALEIPTEDGGSVTIIGKIDRVDVFREGTVAWIRTVDYKTGKQDFKIGPDGSVADGSQLLFYLFTLTRGNPEQAKAFLGGTPREASVCYISSKGIEGTSSAEDEKTVSEDIADQIVRSGCLLNNDSVILAVNRKLDETYTKKLQKVEEPDFDRMFDSVKSGIADAVSRMKAGEASAAGDKLTCDYCSYAPVCRSKNRTVKKETDD